MRMYTPEEAADRLGLDLSTILHRIDAGDIEATAVGDRRRILGDELERFWESLATDMVDFFADDIATYLAP